MLITLVLLVTNSVYLDIGGVDGDAGELEAEHVLGVHQFEDGLGHHDGPLHVHQAGDHVDAPLQHHRVHPSEAQRPRTPLFEDDPHPGQVVGCLNSIDFGIIW